ncbi:MAG: hypothetical protein JNM25_01120 [Planctomycetes bacterium]|nr:hypothetical protein [Planctomycetota bacterium]
MSTRSADVTAQSSSPYVLPGRQRAGADVIVVPAAAGEGFARGGRVAHHLGERFLALAECQQQFLGELRSRLEALDAAIAEDARARLKGALRGALDVLDWCDAVQVDLAAESGWAAAGLEPLDLGEICRAVASEPGPHVGDLQVTGHAGRPWWGQAAVLATALREGLHLISERIGGSGLRQVEIGEDESGQWIRVAGYGEPGDGVEPATVQSFRRAVASLQGRVVPDVLGPGAAAFVLHLPARQA